MLKNPSANAENAGYLGSISRSGRSSGGVHGNPFQYSCLRIHGNGNFLSHKKINVKNINLEKAKKEFK